MDIRVVPVTPNDLIAQWTLVEKLLEKALPVAIGRYLPIDCLAMCSQLGFQAWFVLDGLEVLAVMITQIIQFPRRRALSVFCLSGKRMSEFFELAEQVVSDYGIKMGCDHLELAGRRGWEKVFNLEPRCVFLTRDLGEALRKQTGAK